MGHLVHAVVLHLFSLMTADESDLTHGYIDINGSYRS